MQRLNTDLALENPAQDSIPLVTPIKTARKEFVEPINLLSLGRERTTASVVRTGCIPCLIEGIKCGPLCHEAAVSQAWRVNNDLFPTYHGTWRERRGLHMFIDLALAPQRMGMFGSGFWKQTVMRLVLANAAVFHVASGIGALREHLIRAASDQDGDRGTALAFGLRQCNRSISLLTQAARDESTAYNDPGIALVVCMLFTIFEALYGDPGEALTHVLQGRKILWKCEQFAPGYGGSNVIETLTARPVLGGLQLQAAAMSDVRSVEPSGLLDPLPLPDVSSMYSLEHANRILHVVYSNLLLYHQNLESYVACEDLSVSVTQKRLRFAPWLRMWEKAFAEFLFTQSSTLGHEGIQKAKVLKANHLLSTILAQVDTTSGWQAWEPFTAEFKAIIDLAAAVLTTDNVNRVGDTAGLASMPCMSFGLWISEPLFVCVSRCTKPEYQRQAAGLLNGMPRLSGNRGQQVKRGSLAPSTTSRSGTISRASSSSNEPRRRRRTTPAGVEEGHAFTRPPP